MTCSRTATGRTRPRCWLNRPGCRRWSTSSSRYWEPERLAGQDPGGVAGGVALGADARAAKLLASVPEPWLTVGLLSAGTVLGLIVGFIAQYEEFSAVVSAERITLTRKGKKQEFARDRIVQAFLDGKQLVLLGDDKGELAREACDLDAQRVADAFRAHGYAWVDEDPYKDDFRRWVPEVPGLPQGANALLKARARLLEKKSSTEELRELRGELAGLGVVVRDEKRRQRRDVRHGRNPPQRPGPRRQAAPRRAPPAASRHSCVPLESRHHGRTGPLSAGEGDPR